MIAIDGYHCYISTPLKDVYVWSKHHCFRGWLIADAGLLTHLNGDHTIQLNNNIRARMRQECEV